MTASNEELLALADKLDNCEAGYWMALKREDGKKIAAALRAAASSQAGVLAMREAISCISDLGSGKGGWAWEEVVQQLQEAIDNIEVQAGDNDLCDDCPPVGYPTDKMRCLPCPRRMAIQDGVETATPPSQEPVAWRRRRKGIAGTGGWIMCPEYPSRDKEFDLEPLYNTPPAQPAPAQQAVDVEAVKRAQPAIDNLINHQEQCDQDGVMVKVSRQALEEVLALINGGQK